MIGLAPLVVKPILSDPLAELHPTIDSQPMTDHTQKEVLIVGTYSGLNKGDRLMQQTVAEAVRMYGGKPVIASPFPKIDRELYSGIEIVRARRRNLVLSSLQCLVLWALPERLRLRFAERNAELGRFARASFVVDASGDMLTEDYGPHVALSHLFPLLYCLLLDKKLLVMAQSIGPFKHLGWLFDKVLRHAHAVNVRDEHTYRYLHARGIASLTQVADLGFLLEPRESGGEDVLASVSTPNSRLIGICPSALFFRKFAADKTAVTLDGFCRVLDEMAARHDLAYVVLPHVMTPTGSHDDAALSRELIDRLKARVVMADETLEPAEIKHLVSRLCVMVTFRMHGAIAALDTFVPTLAVSYSHKTDGLFDMLQLGEWVLANDAALLVELGERLPALLAEREVVREQLETRVPPLRERARLNLASIREALR